MEDSDGSSAAPPGSNVILLGASNLAMGLPTVLAALRRQRPAPLRVWAARGHGRSYARRSRVLLRDLPGILECGLWSALSSGPIETPVDALLTDVGNDIVYGATPAALLGWVEESVDRLEPIGARVLITHLPLDSLESLSRVRFEIVRRLIFPAHPLRFETMLERARETDERIGAFARARGITAVPMSPEWYGLDPVHFRIGMRRTAWREILSPWDDPGETTGVAFRSPRWAKPERWWFMGRERTQVQPARRTADGSELWLF